MAKAEICGASFSTTSQYLVQQPLSQRLNDVRMVEALHNAADLWPCREIHLSSQRGKGVLEPLIFALTLVLMFLVANLVTLCLLMRWYRASQSPRPR